MRWRAAAFIAGAGCIGHLSVVGAEVVVAETAVLKAVSVHVVVERTEVNMGICTGYLAQAKLNEFMCGVDGEVMEKGPEGETRNSHRCGGSCLGVNGGGFSAVVAVAAGVGAATAVTALLLPDVLWWSLTRSQVG